MAPLASTAPFVTLKERPDLAGPLDQLSGAPWPEFLSHHPGVNHFFGLLDETFPEFQLALLGADGSVVAIGRTIPFVWRGTVDDLPPTIEALLARGFADRQSGARPTAVSALVAVVDDAHRGSGLSAEVLSVMRHVAARCGATSLLAPVRPTWKHRYPLAPMERYVRWTRDDGLPFDPWLRVHHRLGAAMLAVMPESIVVTGTVAQWEGWTGMALPESGQYIVPGALEPLVIDREADLGRCADPNVWLRHPVGESTLRVPQGSGLAG